MKSNIFLSLFDPETNFDFSILWENISVGG